MEKTTKPLIEATNGLDFDQGILIPIEKAIRPRVTAVDFDGTLCENTWPEIGKPNLKLINRLINCQDHGEKLILWTCRTGDRLNEAVEFCASHDLIFDAINCNIPEQISCFGEDCRKVFADEYIDDKSVVNYDLPYVNSPQNTPTWYENEVYHALSTLDYDDDYTKACYESALKAMRSLNSDGHSGDSIMMTKHMLNRLINHQPLTPIMDTPNVWHQTNPTSQQCLRMPSLFRHTDVNGNVTYNDVDCCYGVNINNMSATYTSKLLTDIHNEMWPISMPYSPPTIRTRFVCEEFLTNPANGSFDLVGVLYAVKDEKEIPIKRYYQEIDGCMVKIPRGRYITLKIKAIKNKYNKLFSEEALTETKGE